MENKFMLPNMKPLVIGLSGRKLSGKTTAANHLKKHLLKTTGIDSRFLSFATKLKQIVIDCFSPKEWNLTVEHLDLENNKNRITPCGKTVRDLLKIVGTDQFRLLYPDVWVRALENSLPPRNNHWIFTDVRFLNEMKFIKSFENSVCIRFLREVEKATHKSETELDFIEDSTRFMYEKNDSFWKKVGKIAKAHLAKGNTPLHEVDFYRDLWKHKNWDGTKFSVTIDNREITEEKKNKALEIFLWTKFGIGVSTPFKEETL